MYRDIFYENISFLPIYYFFNNFVSILIPCILLPFVSIAPSTCLLHLSNKHCFKIIIKRIILFLIKAFKNLPKLHICHTKKFVIIFVDPFISAPLTESGSLITYQFPQFLHIVSRIFTIYLFFLFLIHRYSLSLTQFIKPFYVFCFSYFKNSILQMFYTS